MKTAKFECFKPQFQQFAAAMPALLLGYKRN